LEAAATTTTTTTAAAAAAAAAPAAVENPNQPPNLVIVCDPGPDPDDVKVLLIAAHLHARGVIRVRGVVCNGGGKGQPIKRAALAAAVWEHTGAAPVAVGVGSEGKEYTSSLHEYRLEGFDNAMGRARRWEKDADTHTDEDEDKDEDEDEDKDGDATEKEKEKEQAPTGCCPFEGGVELLKRVLYEVEQEGGTLMLQVQAGMRDVAELMQREPERVVKVVAKCSIMGGLITSLPQHQQYFRPPVASPSDFLPDSSSNNNFDESAAAYVYDFCLTRGVSMNVVSRVAVPPLRMSLAKGFADRNPADAMMRYLCAAQVEGLVGLWGRVCSSQDAREAAIGLRDAGNAEGEREGEGEGEGEVLPSTVTGGLPARCDKRWFAMTFCGFTAEEYHEQQAEVDQETRATIVNRINGTVKPYDVVSLMTLLPGADRVFDFEKAQMKVRATSETGQAVRHFLFLSQSDAPTVESVEGLLCNSFETHVAKNSKSHEQQQLNCSLGKFIMATP